LEFITELVKISGAVLVDVVVDRDWARVVEPGSRRVLHSVRLESTESVGSVAWHVVNARTLAPGRSAPTDPERRRA
jgi:hypothetical protein